MNKGEMLYEGKAKQVFATENPEEVIVKFKDDATAFNAQKRGSFDLKGEMNNAITTLIFEYLQEKIRPITYLPDFLGKGFMVECKGLMGDSFPLRWKLFKYYLKRHRSKIKCQLVRNHKQVDDMIEEIKSKHSH